MAERDWNLFPSIHPGEILKEDFLIPLGISATQLARDIKVDPSRVRALLHGRRGITSDMAARLSIYFGTSIALWLNLQAQYEADEALRHLDDYRAQIRQSEAARRSAESARLLAAV